MARIDPAEQAVIRLETRRFSSRCSANEGLIQRADSLRELSRLVAVSIPQRISGEYEARDAHRRLVTAAEDRARELIQSKIDAIGRADGEYRERAKTVAIEEWANLTGALGHLRGWAQKRLHAAEQAWMG